MTKIDILNNCAKDNPDLFPSLLMSMCTDLKKTPPVVYMVQMYKAKPNTELFAIIKEEIHALMKNKETKKKSFWE